jgi:transcriptional regulator with XRE-family HTH domain
MTPLAGSRVRERRLQSGARQADVARAAGISAAYLNLIEHNRRRIGPAILDRLAAALGVAPDALAEGAEDGLIEDLRAAAAASETPAETDRIEDFVGRFPGWAGLVARTHRRAGQLERAMAALNDRLTHDPHLSLALHEVLSAVSAVRSTAAILAETEDIAPDWRERFHRNLHGDSERLAAGAEALVAYLDGSGEGAETQIATPQEEVDAWLEARGWHLAPLEYPGGVAALETEVAGLASGAARGLARAWVAQAAADAAHLPLAAFSAALAELGPDPARLAARFGVPLPVVFRRMATLPGARVGLVISDAAGALTFRKPVEGFVPPRVGAACALWPLFTALARPMTPIEARIGIAGREGRRFLARAFCQPSYPAGFGGPEVRQALMLVLPETGAEPDPGPVLRVGPTCRICRAAGCPARREPSILSEAETGGGAGAV